LKLMLSVFLLFFGADEKQERMKDKGSFILNGAQNKKGRVRVDHDLLFLF